MITAEIQAKNKTTTLEVPIEYSESETSKPPNQQQVLL